LIKLDNQKLKTIAKIFKENNLKIRVGILGNSPIRSDGQTNADVGAQHEFGTEDLPKRSFLRMPLEMKLNQTIKQMEIMTRKTVSEIYQDRSIVKVLKKIAVVAENIVQEAFDTGGFGKWKPSNFLFKKNHQTLVETQQLRKSITSEVTK
jgi:hypothetical protein